MSNAVDRILGSGAKGAEKPTAYRAFVESGGRPQMGFSITHANGDMDGFLYHSLDNLNYQTRNGLEFLTFTHRAKAVTIQGEQLRAAFHAIMRHTLMEIHEQDGRPVNAGQPTVIRLEVTTVGQGETVVTLTR
jgi:hypothetical protein